MRVVDIDLPDLPQYGLKAAKMERLGKIVILAGQNGAGKTRLLDRLQAWDSEVVFPPVGTRQAFTNLFWSWEEKTKRFSNVRRNAWWRNDEAWASIIARLAISNKKNELRQSMYEIEFSSTEKPEFVRFVPKGIQLADSNDLPPNQLKAHADNAERIGVAQFETITLARIQMLQSRWWNVTHQNSKASAEESKSAIEAYDGLRGMIRRFLGVDLEMNVNGAATLFGMPIGKSQLSDGQKILLQFCVAIHAQAAKLSELIVLMDEPENHLHPGAMLDAINEIQNALTNGQIWIATHSVPLLANFDPDCIWWMNSGGIQHAGSQPEIVLRGLIGDDDRISKLSDFLGLPAALAANNFAYQCLLPPTVIVSDSDDPQSLQIQKLVSKLRADEQLRLLDFGAGRGRLASTIREGGLPLDEIKNRIDYRSFDCATTNKDECESAVARLYGNSSNRCFFSEKDLLANLDKQSVDIIIMCNVLHEIDPKEWPALFSADGMIRQVIKSEGFLLLVEDNEMRIGEKAHPGGFLVLDTPELKTLFQIKEDAQDFLVDDARKDGRLKAHLIPARSLCNATASTLEATLKQSRHLAIQEIKRLRIDNLTSYRQGRKHAFYVQQLANAQLALEGTD